MTPPSPRQEPGSLSREDLHALVWSKPLVSLAPEFGLTRNGLAKICDRLLISYPGRGYWTKARVAEPPPPPPLAPHPEDTGEAVRIDGSRSGSRRSRHRLDPGERRRQLLDAAAQIIAAEGAHAVTMKRIAREGGISEAQAHNYFSRRLDLLLALARRELEAMSAVRQSEVERGHDNLTRVTLSTLAYLRQVAERGVLIQRLLNIPEVRAGLRAERAAQTATARRRMTDRLSDRYGVAHDMAYGATVVLTAVCLRAGRLLAERKITLETAERLSLAIVTSGNRRITRLAREAPEVGPAEA